MLTSLGIWLKVSLWNNCNSILLVSITCGLWSFPVSDWLTVADSDLPYAF